MRNDGMNIVTVRHLVNVLLISSPCSSGGCCGGGRISGDQVRCGCRCSWPAPSVGRDHDCRTDDQADDKECNVPARVVTTGDPADSVGAGPYGHREGEGREEVPQYELAVLHPGRSGNDRRCDEHGEPTPPGIGLLTSFEHALAAVVMPSWPLGKLPAPVITDPVANEAADFSGNRRYDDDNSEIELALAGSNRCCRERGCANGWHPGPRRGDS